MMIFSDLASVPSHPLTPLTNQLRLVVAAYLIRFKSSSREHSESDLAATWPGAPSVAWSRWRAGPC